MTTSTRNAWSHIQAINVGNPTPVPVAHPTWWQPSACDYTTCTDASHAPFTYYRPDVDREVCDLCNWHLAGIPDEAGNPTPGQVWQYPEALRERLQELIAEREGK